VNSSLHLHLAVNGGTSIHGPDQHQNHQRRDNRKLNRRHASHAISVAGNEAAQTARRAHGGQNAVQDDPRRNLFNN
jgi:hypothetical protein